MTVPQLGWLDRIVRVSWAKPNSLWVACVVRFDATLGIVVADSTATLDAVGGALPNVTLHNPHTITEADLTTTTFFDQAWVNPANIATAKMMRIFRVHPHVDGTKPTGIFSATVAPSVLGTIRVQLFRQEDILNASLDLSLDDALPVPPRSEKGPVSGFDGLAGTMTIAFTVDIAAEHLF